MSAKIRKKKRFSNKVRTGCITCKRRRVKCNERKPICDTCIRGQHECLGYDLTIAKLKSRDYVPPSGYLELGSSSSISGDSPKPVVPVRQASPSGYAASIGTTEEQYALSWWLQNTGPMLSLYGAQPDTHTRVVPQLAWEFPALKHMLVAMALMHEKFTRGINPDSIIKTKRSITHYSNAITELRTKPPPRIIVLFASMIGWELGMTQNNFAAARLHLDAMVSLMPSLWDDAPCSLTKAALGILSQNIGKTVGLVQGFHEVCLAKTVHGEVEPMYQDHLYAPWNGISFNSTSEAKSCIVVCIDGLIASRAQGDQNFNQQQAFILLSKWVDTLRSWSQLKTLTPHIMAVLHLFNIAMALLPHNISYGFSYESNPGMIEGVLEDVERLQREYAKSMPAEARAELEDTLASVLSYIVELFPDHGHSERAKGQLKLLCGVQLVRARPGHVRLAVKQQATVLDLETDEERDILT